MCESAGVGSGIAAVAAKKQKHQKQQKQQKMLLLCDDLKLYPFYGYYY